MRATGQNLTNLKSALTTFPLEYEVNISYTENNETITLDNDSLYRVEYYYDGDILKSNMQSLEFETDNSIEKNTYLNFQIKVLKNNSYITLNYGRYKVISCEKIEDSGTYLIKSADDIIETMVDYEDMELTYPIEIGDYLEAICNHLNITLASKIFTNSTIEIPKDLYLNMGYTFRDVLDEISQCSGSSICINSSNQVEVKTFNETNDTINEDYFNDSNVTFGEKYGPINSIVLSRTGQDNASDNVNYSDNESIEEYGLCELKIKDNQIMNDDNRSDFLQGIANNLFGLIYYENNYSSSPQGIFYYNFLDKYSASINNQTYNCLMLNDDLILEQGVSEYIYTKVPLQSKTDYTSTSKSDKNNAKVYKSVNTKIDQVDGRLTTTIEDVNEIDSRVLTIEETADSFNIDIVNQQIENATSPLQEQIDSNTSTIEQNSSDISTMQGQITSMNFNFSTSGLSIGSLGDDISSTLNNQGLKIYNLGTLIAIFNKNGAGVNKLIATESMQLQNLLLKKRSITWTNPFSSSNETIDVVSGFWLKDLIEDLEDLEG